MREVGIGKMARLGLSAKREESTSFHRRAHLDDVLVEVVDPDETEARVFEVQDHVPNARHRAESTLAGVALRHIGDELAHE